MSEVTINIPAEHVEQMRSHVIGELVADGHDLGGCYRKEDRDEVRAYLAKLRMWEEAIEQIGWEGTGEATLTLPAPTLRHVLDLAREDAADYIESAAKDMSKLRPLVAYAEWIESERESLEPQEVAA